MEAVNVPDGRLQDLNLKSTQNKDRGRTKQIVETAIRWREERGWSWGMQEKGGEGGKRGSEWVNHDLDQRYLAQNLEI